ncbi:MAG: PspC domain-containing protein [Bacteroidaceae bacterium]|jgi:phage shock protein PspC (stress-responsive transcriptional regulator)|nr:PspC domain-containing protein [Bacteroidaceae bacterium]
MGKLVRGNKRVFGGVCSGIAESLHWSVAKLRAVWAVMALLSAGSFLVFYLLLWFLMPSAGSLKKSYEERMNARLGRK